MDKSEEFIEFEYLFNILMCERLRGYYNSFESKRVEYHNKLIAKYNLTREQTKTITDNLDKIGFDYNGDYSESELCAIAVKLQNKLIEISKGGKQ